MLSVSQSVDPLWRGPQAWVTIGAELPDPAELYAAVRAGAGVFVQGSASRAHVFSLGFLEPVIEILPSLGIEAADTIVDTGILRRATSLSTLRWVGRSGEPVDVSNLPLLVGFSGEISKITRSVLENPALTRLVTFGAVPAAARRISGVLTEFSHTGARRWGVLPEFASPEALISFTRFFVDDFDLEQLVQFPQLREIDIAHAALTGIGALTSLQHLEFFRVRYSASGDGWESMPTPARGGLVDVEPRPSESLLDLLRQRDRWQVYMPEPITGPYAPFTVEALDEEVMDGGWTWGLFLSESEFGSITSSTEARDRGGLSGWEIEQMVENLVDELRDEGKSIDAFFDSESGFFAVYFQNESDANVVAEVARGRLVETSPGAA